MQENIISIATDQVAAALSRMSQASDYSAPLAVRGALRRWKKSRLICFALGDSRAIAGRRTSSERTE
jgi:hypothetical protein